MHNKINIKLISMIYLLNSKYLRPVKLVNALSLVDRVLMRHVLLELSKSNDLQRKESSERQADAQDSGLLLDSSLSGLPDM